MVTPSRATPGSELLRERERERERERGGGGRVCVREGESERERWKKKREREMEGGSFGVRCYTSMVGSSGRTATILFPGSDKS